MRKLLILLTIIFTLVSFKTPPQRILFIGDSLTCYRYGWQHQVAVAKGHTYLNLAYSGKTLDWMKYTLDKQLKKDAIWSTALIYGGCNDAFCLVSLEKSLQYTQMMVDSCNSRGIRPVVVIGFDAEKVMKKTIYSDEITIRSRNRYALLQKMMKEKLKNCKIIPVDPNFTYEDTWDGVHFRGTGHRKIADWVLKHL
jgi:lysophospholipase L1-like esterase